MIIDNYSTDNTVEIAKRYTNEVYLYKNTGWVEDEQTTNFVLGKVTTDWVYWGSVDELLPKTLLNKLVELSFQDQYKLVIMRRRNYHYGSKTLYLQNALQQRFFRKGAIDFKNNKIHAFGKVLVSPHEILYLPMNDSYSIHHFSTYNISKFEIAHSKYSDIEAKQKFENGVKFSRLKLFLHPIMIFLRYYFINGGWKSGWRGFFMTMQYCFFFFNGQAKIWELENDIILETIEKSYDRLKDEMINGPMR